MLLKKMGIALEQVDAYPICNEQVEFTQAAVIAQFKPYYVLRCPGCTGSLAMRCNPSTIFHPVLIQASFPTCPSL